MQRVTRSTAVAAQPAPPSNPGAPGYFTAGNPSGGQVATQPGYEWYNGVQEELMAVIEGQGLAGSSTNNTLLRQAITKMIQSAQREVVISGAVFAPAVTASGQVVYWDSANSRFDLALADGSAKQNAVGVADLTNSAVVAFGDAVLFAGLTPGSRYYLSTVTAGTLTAILPVSNAVQVGIARSATEMFVDIDVMNFSDYLKPIDNTGAVSDLSLGVGQTAYVVFGPATSIPLHIACGDNQIYEIKFACGAAGNSTNNLILNPNNTTYTNAFTRDYGSLVSNGTLASGVTTESFYSLTTDGVPYEIQATVWTKTNLKRVISSGRDTNTTNGSVFMHGSEWNDTTTVHSSVGTLTCATLLTGRVDITRKA